MNLKILTIPFDEKLGEFKNELLDRNINNKKIETYKAELIKVNEKFFWTVFVKYDELEGIEIFKDSNILNEAETSLLGNLKEWRSEEAKKQGIPSYVIAKNEHLISIVKNKPKTLQDLKLINGIGEKKAKDYGEKILEIVKKFYGDE